MELSGGALRHHQQDLEGVPGGAPAFGEGEGADVGLGRQEHVELARFGLAEDVAGGPQRNVRQVERGVERPLEGRVAPFGARGVGRLAARRVVAAAGPHREARARHLDLDPPEETVRALVDRAVAHEVVARGLAADAQEPRLQVVRVPDAEAPGVRGQTFTSLAPLLGFLEGGAQVVEVGPSQAGVRAQRGGGAGEPPRVEEVDGHVRPARLRDRAAEAGEVRVVHEAAGDEDERLAAADPGERPEGPLDDAEGGLVVGGRARVGLGGPGPRLAALRVQALAPVGRLARELHVAPDGPGLHEPAGHAVGHEGVQVAIDAHGLVVADLVGRPLEDAPPLQAGEDLEERRASLGQAGRPGRPLRRPDERDPIPRSDSPLEEPRDRAASLLRLRRLQVSLVEDDDEAALLARGGLGVGDRARRCGRFGRGAEELHGPVNGLERRDDLGRAVFEHRELGRAQAHDGHALAVRDHHIHGDDLGSRGIRGLRVLRRHLRHREEAPDKGGDEGRPHPNSGPNMAWRAWGTAGGAPRPMRVNGRCSRKPRRSTSARQAGRVVTSM